MGKYKSAMEKERLTLRELMTAETQIIRYSQNKLFPEEMKALCCNLCIKRNSQLYKLDPTLQDGILRVGGRLEKSGMPEYAKHPVIFSKRYKLPFTNVGIDYFGPLDVKRGQSAVKRYGVLFTCLTIRAVHIEVANSLDTSSCINALCRFISRRGQVSIMCSDNGTSFVGAEKELREAIENLNQTHTEKAMQKKGIKWIFNSPAASHQGGVWERQIRTVRRILGALVKEQTLTGDSLQTLMCEVESVINGHLITSTSDDPHDVEPLTPNHLLVMKVQPNVPPGTFSKDDQYARRRWR